jgi:hypothetical protein
LKCPGKEDNKSEKGKVEIYLLEQNPGIAYAFLVALPLMAFTAFSIGFSPLVKPSRYTVCLEYISPGGRREIFTNMAHSTVIANIWGMAKQGDAKQYYEEESRIKRVRILDPLTESVWEKLMTVEPSTDYSSKTCLEILRGES